MGIDGMGSWQVNPAGAGPEGALPEPRRADLLIRDGLHHDGRQRRVFTRGYVAIHDGRVAAVGGGDPPAALTPARVIDGSKSIVMPALVNAHAHLDHSIYRGLFDDISPGQREGLMGRMMLHQTAERAYVAACLTLLELVKNGVITPPRLTG